MGMYNTAGLPAWVGVEDSAGFASGAGGGVVGRAGGVTARGGGVVGRAGGVTARAGGFVRRAGGVTARAGGVVDPAIGVTGRAAGLNMAWHSSHTSALSRFSSPQAGQMMDMQSLGIIVCPYRKPA